MAIRKKILLTGAGFYNFGGILATGIWGIIFNNKVIQDRPVLRKKMLSSYDFEYLYEEIINKEDTQEKSAFVEAVHSAYVLMDKSIRNKNPGKVLKKLGISTYQLTKAIPEKLRHSLPTIEEIEAELNAPI